MKVIATILFSSTLLITSAQLNSPPQVFFGHHLQSNTIRTAYPFLLFSPDARSSGLGDVGVAISPTANSFHWNTANLGFSEETSEISVSYAPWLRQIVDDINLFYFSGYAKIGKTKRHSLGGSIRYISLGDITYTDNIGNILKEFKPQEFEILGGYAMRLSERSTIGVNAKFIHSDLITPFSSDSLQLSPAMSAALDLSYGYLKNNIMIREMPAALSWGVSFSNLGNKILYDNPIEKKFLPANFRIGAAVDLQLAKDHRLTISVDLNKLMVPNLDTNSSDYTAIGGVFRSFNDSPEGMNGELKEFTFGSGIEYRFRDFISLRSGFFYENPSLGNRRFATVGAGVRFKSIGIDGSYLMSVTQNNPISNTMRVSLSYIFKNRAKKTDKV